MATTKVLIVDDEAEFRQTLSERMQLRDIEVETAMDGQEALDKVADGSYDAIVLDMVMPGMDGIEALKKLKEKRPELQIILLTGHATLEKGMESVKLGALDFLEKPVDFDTLLTKIHDAKAKRLVLVEKAWEKKINDILSKKGW